MAECEPSDVIVIRDDIAIPWGMIRVLERGSAGGNNGLKSVIGALGTMEFARVRMGVQPADMKGDLRNTPLPSAIKNFFFFFFKKKKKKKNKIDVGGRHASRDESFQSPGVAAGVKRKLKK